MQTWVAVFRGDSLRQSRLVSASSHPAVVARLARDLIEIDGENAVEVHDALRDALGELSPSPA